MNKMLDNQTSLLHFKEISTTEANLIEVFVVGAEVKTLGVGEEDEEDGIWSLKSKPNLYLNPNLKYMMKRRRKKD